MRETRRQALPGVRRRGTRGTRTEVKLDCWLEKNDYITTMIVERREICNALIETR